MKHATVGAAPSDVSMARAAEGLDIMQLREITHSHPGVLAFLMAREDGSSTTIRRPPLDCYLLGIGMNIATIRIDVNGRTLRRGAYGPHGVHLVQPRQDAEYVFTGRVVNIRLRLSPAAVAASLDAMDQPSAGVELADAAERSDAHLGVLSRQLLRHAFAAETDRLRIDSLVQSLIDRIVATHATRPFVPRRREGLAPASLRRAMDLIQQDYMNEITLDALAAAARLSRAHFLRGFRREVGMTPHAFVTMVRLREAGALIRSTRRRLADIAVATGFASHAHMSSVFRQTLALSPSELRDPVGHDLKWDIRMTAP